MDPPRAGLDPATEALLPEFANVVYISCNPATLEANLRPLLATHSLRRFAVFDQARLVAMLVSPAVSTPANTALLCGHAMPIIPLSACVEQIATRLYDLSASCCGFCGFTELPRVVHGANQVCAAAVSVHAPH